MPEFFDPTLLLDDPSIAPNVQPEQKDVLKSLLSTAFFASLLSNEGRSVVCTLAVESGSVSSSRGSMFESPVALNPESLAALFPAARPEEMFFLVSSHPKRGIEIHGLIRRPRQSGGLGIRVAALVTINGPGKVGLVVGKGEIEYRRGVILRWSEKAGSWVDRIAGWAGEAIRQAAQYVSTPQGSGEFLPLGIRSIVDLDPGLWAMYGKRFVELAGKNARELAAPAVLEITRTIRDGHHGGGLLLVSGSPQGKDIGEAGHWFREREMILRDPFLELGLSVGLVSKGGIRSPARLEGGASLW